MKYRYYLSKMGQVGKYDSISYDGGLTFGEVAGIVVAMNTGAMKEDDWLWFGTKEDYFIAGDEEPVIVRVKK